MKSGERGFWRPQGLVYWVPFGWFVEAGKLTESVSARAVFKALFVREVGWRDLAITDQYGGLLVYDWPQEMGSYWKAYRLPDRAAHLYAVPPLVFLLRFWDRALLRGEWRRALHWLGFLDTEDEGAYFTDMRWSWPPRAHQRRRAYYGSPGPPVPWKQYLRAEWRWSPWRL